MVDMKIPENQAAHGDSRISLPHLVSAIRKQSGLTQAALAEKASVGRLTVVAAEGGEDVRLSSIMAMFRALDCELMPVPRRLVAETRRFINNGGRSVSIEPGVEAPLSVMQTAPEAREKGSQ